MNASIKPNVISRSIPPDYVIREFMTSSRGTCCRIHLGDDDAMELLKTVYSWAKRNLPSLNPSRMHLGRDVCGLHNWNTMKGKGSRRNYAGMCLAFLVDAEALPLRMHRTKSGKGPKKYWVHIAEHSAKCSSREQLKLVVVSAKDIVVNRR